MRKLLYTTFIFAVLGIVSLNAQTLVKLKGKEGLYNKEYSALESDTSIYHGLYQLVYKGKVIEKGHYNQGEKVGNWQYFSFDNIFDLEYNFDEKKLTRISSKKDFDLDKFSPSFFLGSPVIPYLYMVTNLSYPEKAMDMEISGRVTLSLRIDSRGQIYGYYISEKLHPLLDKAVMEAAGNLPPSWKFIPARRNKLPCDSEYQIAVEFELEIEDQN